ncbi:MAG: 4Fe-4S dicluster domain-containing protein, partial [Eggerthellaceae bacterium]|nr:4Fe-4S dicluster domain-containing protein [Eggerthellaceae bacterium]
MLDYIYPRYKVYRDKDLCVQCGVCERTCSNEVHHVDEELGVVRSDDKRCVNCQRCVVLCPTGALSIMRWPQSGGPSTNWTLESMQDIARQAQSGGVLLSSMGNSMSYPIYWDHLLLNASQVTNPS